MSFMFLEQPATGRIFRLEPATGSAWVWLSTRRWWRKLGAVVGPDLISEHPVVIATELPDRGKP